MIINNEISNDNDGSEAADERETLLPVCRFCGRKFLPETNYKTIEEESEAATLHCDCAAAQEYQAESEQFALRERSLNKLDECVKEFAQYCRARGSELAEEVGRMLTFAGEQILKGIIDKMTLSFGRIKTSVTINSKGNLVIGFTYADSTKTEVI